MTFTDCRNAKKQGGDFDPEGVITNQLVIFSNCCNKSILTEEYELKMTRLFRLGS